MKYFLQFLLFIASTSAYCQETAQPSVECNCISFDEINPMWNDTVSNSPITLEAINDVEFYVNSFDKKVYEVDIQRNETGKIQRSEITDKANSATETTTYTYDANNKLIKAAVSGISNGVGGGSYSYRQEEITYSYNARGFPIEKFRKLIVNEKEQTVLEWCRYFYTE